MLSNLAQNYLNNYPGTTSIFGVNIVLNVLQRLGLTHMDDHELHRAGFYNDHEYSRLFKCLLQHTNDLFFQHMSYNLLHMLMVLPICEQLLEKDQVYSRCLEKFLPFLKNSFLNNNKIFRSSVTMWSLFWTTGIAGAFAFLKGVEILYYERMGEAVDWISLIGNSPSAYGMHTYAMITYPAARNPSDAILFGIISSVPPLITYIEDLRRRRIGSASIVEKVKTVVAPIVSGLAHYYAIRKIFGEEGPTLSQSFLIYTFFRRWSQGFIEKSILGIGGNDSAGDDHIGHLAGAVTGCCMGLFTRYMFPSSLREEAQFNKVDASVVCIVMAELFRRVYQQAQ